ncbi:MAG TPA: DNA-processing protein DprA [Solirubrobacteraceae bacterium]
MNRACDDCARRGWLLGYLAGRLEIRRADRGAIREVLALGDEQLIEALGGRDRARVTLAWEEADPARLRAAWDAVGCVAICAHDARYPAGLRDLSDPPAVLFVLGDPLRLDALLGAARERGGRHQVAVVGARRASLDGQATARALGRGLSVAGITVVSGMALGIDSAAHEGALEGGGRTVAVLACGPEYAYPPRRRSLHRRLVEEALVVSELPPGTTPYRWAFPARNRIIAALAEMTVLVEAAERSGSLITAEIAMDLGREVGAAPGAPTAWHSTGTNALLRDGARVVRHALDVLDDVIGVLPVGAPNPRRVLPAPVGLAPELHELLTAIDGGADTVAGNAASPAQARAVLGRLTELELLGLVERRPGGRYVRVTL